MSKRITINAKMSDDLYSCIHAEIMAQRLKWAKNHKYSIPIDNADTDLSKLVTVIFDRVNDVLGVALQEPK